MAGDRDPIGNTGLTERLEQHSRRNGFTLGVAMGACILIGLAGFIYLYTHLTILPDFSQKLSVTDVPAARAASGSSAAGSQLITPAATIKPGTPNANATSIAGISTTAASSATANSSVATPGASASGTPTVFKANFRIAGGFTIRFRSDATTSSAIVKSLPPGTELQYLNQEQTVDGEVWRKLRDATGAEGWVRDIDLEKLPG
ncbi:MAG: SH3 domain-containing protein [Chloroflexota bacterium]|nr:SH3 domain-containing protein [Chloroflexota bacterium]